MILCALKQLHLINVMKKQTKQKLKNKLSKLKKPLMIISILFNIIFGLALIIGLSSNKSKVDSVSAYDVPADYNGVSFRFNDTIDFSSIPNGGFLSSVSFTSNDVSFNQIDVVNHIIGYKNDSTLNVYFYDTSIGVTRKWTGYEDYQVITIHQSSISVNFEAFLQRNAVIVDTPPDPEPDVNDYVDTIFLSDNFNPVVYVTQNGEYILNGFAGKHSSADTFILEINSLHFVSNGFEYNSIKFLYGSLSAIAPIVTQDGSTSMNMSGYGDYMVCFGMYYQFYETGNSIPVRTSQVMSYRQTIIEDNGTTYKAYDVRQPYILWLNNEFRTLNIISDSEQIVTGSYLTQNGYTGKQLLQLTSTVNAQVMGLTDVFGLFKGAFTGLTGILSVSILPGITLGLLLFIPLIVTIIITVVRLIKK